jgi:hypothetical protein
MTAHAFNNASDLVFVPNMPLQRILSPVPLPTPIEGTIVERFAVLRLNMSSEFLGIAEHCITPCGLTAMWSLMTPRMMASTKLVLELIRCYSDYTYFNAVAVTNFSLQ